MSVELRVCVEGECDHGPKYPHEPRSRCDHTIVCDWGRIEYPDPRPDLSEVGYLMLITADYVDELVHNGPLSLRYGRRDSVTVNGDRIIARTEYGGQRWAWELFEAHWWDGAPQNPALYVGRWPD
ncbi:MAG: hypothetical protein ACPGXI_10705 [Mycobacterium sp.]